MPIYNKLDMGFEDFLRNTKKIKRRDVELLLGGCGPPYLLEFLATEGPKKGQYESKLLADKKFEEIECEDICEYARVHKDELCLETLNLFMEYLAKYLFDLACIFQPYGGIYLTSTIIVAVQFLFE